MFAGIGRQPEKQVFPAVREYQQEYDDGKREERERRNLGQAIERSRPVGSAYAHDCDKRRAELADAEHEYKVRREETPWNRIRCRSKHISSVD